MTLVRCMLCFEGTEDRPCKHLWPEPPPGPPAPPPPVPAAGTDLEFTTPTPTAVVSADPLDGLRSPHAPAARWATASRVVKFAQGSGFIPWPRQAEILARTADSDARIVVLCLGRRSGKDEMACTLALFEATANAARHRAALQPGEAFTVALIGNSNDQSRQLIKTLKRKLRHPTLAPLVERQSGDSVTLSTGAVIVAFPTNARVIRGYAIAVVILTEFAHAMDSEGRALSAQDAGELLDAVIPATAQFASGRVIVSSTPKWASGVFHDLLKAGDDPLRPEVLAFRYSTPEVNPTIDPAFFRLEAGRDYAGFMREYMAVADDSISGLFDADAIRACVARRDDLGPSKGVRYIVSLDPAWRRDSFGLVCAHRDGERIVVDLVREWRPGRLRPLDHRKLADEIAALALAYNGAKVTSDQAGADAVIASLSERGVHATSYAWSSTSKVSAADKLRQRIWAGTIELPSSPALVASLTSLERKSTPSGAVRIEAAPGASDDLAHALLGAVVELEKGTGKAITTHDSPWN